MGGAVDAPLEDELPVFMVEQAATSTDNKNSTFALEHDFSTTLQLVTQANGTDLAGPSLAESINAHAANAISQTAAKELYKTGTGTTITKNKALVQRTHNDGALRKLVPESLRQEILSLSYYPPLAAHPGQQRMYNTMRREHILPNMGFHVQNSASNCKS